MRQSKDIEAEKSLNLLECYPTSGEQYTPPYRFLVGSQSTIWPIPHTIRIFWFGEGAVPNQDVAQLLGNT
jgi:hypothetical protein